MRPVLHCGGICRSSTLADVRTTRHLRSSNTPLLPPKYHTSTFYFLSNPSSLPLPCLTQRTPLPQPTQLPSSSSPYTTLPFLIRTLYFLQKPPPYVNSPNLSLANSHTSPTARMWGPPRSGPFSSIPGCMSISPGWAGVVN